MAASVTVKELCDHLLENYPEDMRACLPSGNIDLSSIEVAPRNRLVLHAEESRDKNELLEH